MADNETQPTEETKLDADVVINASIEAAQVEHGGESDGTETSTDAVADTSVQGSDVNETTVDKVADTKDADGDKGETDNSGGKLDGGGLPKETAPPDAGEQSLEAPTHWPSDRRELFQKHPKDVQEFMLNEHKEMSADYTHKLGEIAPLRNVMQKWNSYLTQTGQAPDYAFDLLMSAEQRLRSGTAQDKVAVLKALAADYNIPLEGLDSGTWE